MSDIVSPLLQWLNAHPHLSGLVTFIISAGESVAIIGTIVPGSIMMTALGTLAGAGVIPLWSTIIWAILGAIVGDGISYWMGHYFKERLPRMWPFNRYPDFLTKGEVFFLKYGSMSVFIGRFVGPVRALVPLVAGMMGMKPLQFTLANIASAIFWAPAYMLPGILLGAASLELPPEIAIHVILVVLLITLFILLCLWFTYKLFRVFLTRTRRLQINLWLRLKSSRSFTPLLNLIKHHNEKMTYGQLGLAFYFLCACAALLILASYVTYIGAPHLAINETVYHLFRGIRSDYVYHGMLDLTLLGQKEVLLPATLIIFAWLLLIKRYRTALHLFTLAVLAAGGVYVFKHLFLLERPWGLFHSSENYSMPSGHATLSAAIYLGVAYLLAHAFPRRKQWPFYAVAILLILSIGFSRLYLGAHWFTDIMAGWLLSIAIFTVVIISYQRQKEAPLPTLRLFTVTFLSIAICYGLYHYSKIDQLKVNYVQVGYPIVQINQEDWWQHGNVLPRYRASLFGFSSDLINIEWEGNLDQIRETLLKAGWEKPPARDLISTLHRLTGVESTSYLPLVSPQYLDKRPVLTLTRQIDQDTRLLVIRLWNANRIMQETNLPLWAGMIGIIPKSYSWLDISKRTAKTFTIDPSLVFADTQNNIWEWKMLTRTITKKKRSIQQSILLIRQKSTPKK